ncbi:MAG: amino acid aminotransferase [Chlamydiota bacterium]|nr:amino acid aminotransferase [Chlamydiota bacterium]
MTLFDSIEMLPDDPIFGLVPLFNADTRPEKINLSVGSYKDSDGKALVLTAVRKAEEKILEQQLNKEYQPIDGDPTYRHETLKLIFGESSFLVKNEGVYAAQTVGASGALRIGAEFLHQRGIKTIAVSTPTWSNHLALLGRGGLEILKYSYYDEKIHDIDFAKMCDSIRELPRNSAILLHGCCHNPTGIDPTIEQWKELSKIIKECSLVPFFDFAYQGFKEELDLDAQGIRIFAEDGHQMLVAYSYSKNFGLYGERAGALCAVTHDKEISTKVQSNIKKIIRGSYSSPSLQSARIVKTVLTTPELKSEWIEELANMRNRIFDTRNALIAKLHANGNIGDFQFMNKQRGMFGFMGLAKDQVLMLQNEHAIYMPSSGRINIAGLNPHNIVTFIEALKEVSHG